MPRWQAKLEVGLLVPNQIPALPVQCRDPTGEHGPGGHDCPIGMGDGASVYLLGLKHVVSADRPREALELEVPDEFCFDQVGCRGVDGLRDQDLFVESQRAQPGRAK